MDRRRGRRRPDRLRPPAAYAAHRDLVSLIINRLLAAPRLFAPGGVAPPRPCPVIMSASSARLARHDNPQADRASYLWDRTLAGQTASELGQPGRNRRRGKWSLTIHAYTCIVCSEVTAMKLLSLPCYCATLRQA